MKDLDLYKAFALKQGVYHKSNPHDTYQIDGFTKVKVNGEWVDAVGYSSDCSFIRWQYVRLIDNFDNFSVNREDFLDEWKVLMDMEQRNWEAMNAPDKVWY